MEYGDASGTALLDIKTDLDKRLIDCIDSNLLKALPSLIEAHMTSGYLLGSVASSLGLKEGIVVSSGGGDNMMGAIGTGTVSDGTLTMSLGTSGTIFGASDKPIIDPQGASSGLLLLYRELAPLLCTMNVRSEWGE